MTVDTEARVFRVAELGGRSASVLENGLARVLVDDKGGMIPEFSSISGAGTVNAHWVPTFRGNAGRLFSQEKDGPFWKAELLYDIAGTFPCAPNFGPAHGAGTDEQLPHGWTANLPWKFETSGIEEESGCAWTLSTMESPNSAFPLSFRKIDAVVPGQAVHYASLSVENRGAEAMEINIGWHNTVGSPFLEAGCRVSACAESWATPPFGGEFDETGRLAMGAEFEALERAPTRNGGLCDLSVVSGPIGYTDFASGAVPRNARLGWSAVVNGAQKLVYLCFFPGPAAVGEEDIALSFNDLWMQYGGRRFTPWAAYEGGSDLSYCLGTENAVGAYAYGLDYAKRHPTILGSPTTVSVPGRSTRTLRYGTLFAPYSGDEIGEGVKSVEEEQKALALHGRKGTIRFPAEGRFETLARLERTV